MPRTYSKRPIGPELFIRQGDNWLASVDGWTRIPCAAVRVVGARFSKTAEFPISGRRTYSLYAIAALCISAARNPVALRVAQHFDAFGSGKPHRQPSVLNTVRYRMIVIGRDCVAVTVSGTLNW